MRDRGSVSSGGGSDAAFERKITLQAVTLIMAAVVGLTFLFGFGNVWTLALRLGVPPWVAPLIAPAVDLSVMGLLLGTRYLALHGARHDQLRPARRLLIFSSLMTLALNVTDPLLADQMGKAAFDSVGPLLLIGWAEVGPGLLQAISGVREGTRWPSPDEGAGQHLSSVDTTVKGGADARPWNDAEGASEDQAWPGVESAGNEDDLLDRARREDARHRDEHRRPISAETLRKRLRIGAGRSRMLVAIIRSEDSTQERYEAQKLVGLSLPGDSNSVANHPRPT